MGKLIDLTGQTFGLLTVIERAEKPVERKVKGVYWLCLCECKNTKVTLGKFLKNGTATSCGCKGFSITNL